MSQKGVHCLLSYAHFDIGGFDSIWPLTNPVAQPIVASKKTFFWRIWEKSFPLWKIKDIKGTKLKHSNPNGILKAAATPV